MVIYLCIFGLAQIWLTRALLVGKCPPGGVHQQHQKHNPQKACLLKAVSWRLLMIYDPHVPLTTPAPRTESKAASFPSVFAHKVSHAMPAGTLSGPEVGSADGSGPPPAAGRHGKTLAPVNDSATALLCTRFLYLFIHLCFFFFCGACTTAGASRLAHGPCSFGGWSRKVVRPCYLCPVRSIFFFPTLAE